MTPVDKARSALPLLFRSFLARPRRNRSTPYSIASGQIHSPSQVAATAASPTVLTFRHVGLRRFSDRALAISELVGGVAVAAAAKE